MELNLHIVAFDLADFGVKARLESDHLDRTLQYAAPYDFGEPAQPNILYVLYAKDLPRVTVRRTSKTASVIYSFFCIGEPDESMLPDCCDVAWVSEETDVMRLITGINALFSRYNEWHLALERAIVRNKPIRLLGALSQGILPFPMWVYDRQFQTLFHVVDKRHYALPEGYVFREDQAPWPAWEVDAWHDGVKSGVIDMDAIRNATRPYLLPSTSRFPYRALCMNVFLGAGYEATVSLDEVAGGFSKRDESVLSFFTDIMTSAIRRDIATNTSITYALDQKLKRMLDNESLSEIEIRGAINSIGWNMHDPYICITAVPANPFYASGVLVQVGEKVCKDISGLIYQVVNKSIVFIKNRRNDDTRIQELADRISSSLQRRSCKMQLGVSTIFSDFSFLYLYYRQGVKIIEWGREELEHPQAMSTFYYDDFIMRSIVANVCDHAAAEIICPTGLMLLIEYDRAHGGDLVPILHEYLNNNMYVSETSRKLFIHRNTLINKIKKINEIMQIDLDDGDKRLEVMLALRTLNAQRIIDVNPENAYVN